MMKSVTLRASLAEYANTILNDRRVIEMLNSISISNALAEKVISLIPMELGKESFNYATLYADALRQAKRSSLLQIVERDMPWKWVPGTQQIENAVRGNADMGEPELEDLPFLMFCLMLLDPDFQEYALNGKLPWLSAPLPTRGDRIDIFVVVLFLWLKMDVRYDETKKMTYYVRAVEKTKRRNISTVESRERFLYFFGEYLHTDLWTASDYDEQHAKGTVIRLRVTDSQCGLIVVQSCGQVSPSCNTIYTITAESIEYLRNNLLAGPGTVLTRSAPPNASTITYFQCYRCGSEKACLFQPSDLTRFYCNNACYLLMSTHK